MAIVKKDLIQSYIMTTAKYDFNVYENWYFINTEFKIIGQKNKRFVNPFSQQFVIFVRS